MNKPRRSLTDGKPRIVRRTIRGFLRFGEVGYIGDVASNRKFGNLKSRKSLCRRGFDDFAAWDTGSDVTRSM